MANQKNIAVVDIKRVVGDGVEVHASTLAEKLNLPEGVFGNIEHDHRNQQRQVSEIYKYVLNNYNPNIVWGKLARAFREMRLYEAAKRLQRKQNPHHPGSNLPEDLTIPNTRNGSSHTAQVQHTINGSSHTAQVQQSKKIGQAIFGSLFLCALIALYGVFYYKSMWWVLGCCIVSCLLVGCMLWFGLQPVQSVVTILNTLRQLVQLF